MFSSVMLLLGEKRRHIRKMAILGWVARSPHVVRVDDASGTLNGGPCHLFWRPRRHRVVTQFLVLVAILGRDEAGVRPRRWL